MEFNEHDPYQLVGTGWLGGFCLSIVLSKLYSTFLLEDEQVSQDLSVRSLRENPASIVQEQRRHERTWIFYNRENPGQCDLTKPKKQQRYSAREQRPPPHLENGLDFSKYTQMYMKCIYVMEWLLPCFLKVAIDQWIPVSDVLQWCQHRRDEAASAASLREQCLDFCRSMIPMILQSHTIDEGVSFVSYRFIRFIIFSHYDSPRIFSRSCRFHEL